MADHRGRGGGWIQKSAIGWATWCGGTMSIFSLPDHQMISVRVINNCQLLWLCDRPLLIKHPPSFEIFNKSLSDTDFKTEINYRFAWNNHRLREYSSIDWLIGVKHRIGDILSMLCVPIQQTNYLKSVSKHWCNKWYTENQVQTGSLYAATCTRIKPVQNISYRNENFREKVCFIRADDYYVYSTW